MKNAGKKAIAATSAIALSAIGVLGVAPQTVLAAGNTGSVTVEKTNSMLDGITYKGYKIFNSDFTDAGKAKNITWVQVSEDDNAIETAVTKVLKNFDPDYAGTTAFDALDYIEERIQATSPTSGVNLSSNNETVLAFETLGNKIAMAIEALPNNDAYVTTEVEAGGTADNLTDGYYLFCAVHETLNSSDDETVTYQMATAPAFVAVQSGKPASKIIPKTSIPTVTKTVQEDSKAPVVVEPDTGDDTDENDIPSTDEGAEEVGDDEEVIEEGSGDAVVKNYARDDIGYGERADAMRNQDLSFRLIGTVPEEVVVFDEFKYEFVDTLDEGLTALADSITVENEYFDEDEGENGELVRITIDPSEYVASVSEDGRTLSVKFANAKKYAGQSIVVKYLAHLNDKAIIGTDKTDGEGNTNSVVVKYSNNPHVITEEAVSEATPSKVEVLTYELRLHKVAEDYLDRNLSGVQFTIQDDKGRYIGSDGSFVDEKDAKIATNDDGMIYIKGIDAGEYTVTEIKAHNGYVDLRNPIKVTVSSEIEDETVNGIACAVDNANGDLVVLDTLDGKQAVVGSEGVMNVLVKNAPTLLNLPITGEEGVKIFGILCGALVAGALVVVVRREAKKGKTTKE